jgi:hypothetical protein
VNIGQHVNVSFVPLHHCHQITPASLPYFSYIFVWPSLWHALPTWPYSSLFFSLSDHQIRQERKMNSPHTVCDLLLLLSWVTYNEPFFVWSWYPTVYFLRNSFIFLAEQLYVILQNTLRSIFWLFSMNFSLMDLYLQPNRTDCYSVIMWKEDYGNIVINMTKKINWD